MQLTLLAGQALHASPHHAYHICRRTLLQRLRRRQQAASGLLLQLLALLLVVDGGKHVLLWVQWMLVLVLLLLLACSAAVIPGTSRLPCTGPPHASRQWCAHSFWQRHKRTPRVCLQGCADLAVPHAELLQAVGKLAGL